MTRFEQFLLGTALTKEEKKALYLAYREEIAAAEQRGRSSAKSDILEACDYKLIGMSIMAFGDNEEECFNIVTVTRKVAREILNDIENA